MWDQIQALEFIKRNIIAFRGDPNRITIMGEGAGGVSVGLHLVSPASTNKGLLLHFRWFNLILNKNSECRNYFIECYTVHTLWLWLRNTTTLPWTCCSGSVVASTNSRETNQLYENYITLQISCMKITLHYKSVVLKLHNITNQLCENYITLQISCMKITLHYKSVVWKLHYITNQLYENYITLQISCMKIILHYKSVIWKLYCYFLFFGIGYYKQAILMSGTDLSMYGVAKSFYRPRQYAMQMANLLNCPSKDSYSMILCLRDNTSISWEEIVQAQSQILPNVSLFTNYFFKNLFSITWVENF